MGQVPSGWCLSVSGAPSAWSAVALRLPLPPSPHFPGSRSLGKQDTNPVLSGGLGCPVLSARLSWHLSILIPWRGGDGRYLLLRRSLAPKSHWRGVCLCHHYMAVWSAGSSGSFSSPLRPVTRASFSPRPGWVRKDVAAPECPAGRGWTSPAPGLRSSAPDPSALGLDTGALHRDPAPVWPAGELGLANE